MSALRKNASALWAYYDKDDVNKKAQCHLCHDSLSYKSTTANLRNHLKRKHIGTYTSLTEEENPEIQSRRNEDVTSYFSQPSTSRTAAQSDQIIVPPPTKKSQKMDAYINKKISTEQKKKIDQDLLDLCIDSFHPFSIVEERSFIKFCRWIPGYKLPTRKTLSNSLLDETYHRVENEIKSQVTSEVQSICLSTDLWTSRSTESYIAVTGHYLNDVFEFKTVLLGCCYFSGNHTSQNIASEIKDIVDRWGINGKVNFVVSDNGANVVKAVKEILGLKHFGCFAHTLNLIVQDGLKFCKDKIDKVRRIVTHYKKSTVSAERLAKYQLQQNIQPKHLIQDVDTRWNSTFYMLSRFVELKEAVRSTMALIDRDLPQLTAEDWSMFEELIVVLRPFEELTKSMSGEKYLTASSVIVMTRCLKEALNIAINKTQSETVSDIALLLNAGITDRLKYVEKSRTLSLCTFMDPRFKMQAFAEQNEAIQTKEYVKKLIADIISRDENVELPTEQNQESQPQSDDDLSPWTIFDKLLGQPMTQGTPLSRAIKEIDMYLSDDRLPRKNSAGGWNCPLEWWKNHRAVYPNLAKLYIRQCNIVATSVPCERMFSKSGLIINQRRTRLTTKKVEKLMFLNVNMPEERFKM
ncbi:zinc finger BED domain-containing protein 1-like [Spodoptera litura]|uniref:Zinc finger BED domain-containing protein 1-like n=1 Tax=Spodoptera litura TaxID=69820 RepID=A0A9J7EDM5_SPOLT|nr:zinc finger BED domain-containing protein 1-like [Spodoptera litura]